MTPSIYAYADYRHFLRDFLSKRKKEAPGYSLSVLGRNSRGLSKAQLSQVANGKRNIAAKNVPTLSKALRLGKDEQKFFECLVHFNQARGGEQKQIYLERLSTLAPKIQWSQIAMNQYLFARSWHAPVLRELLQLPNFSDDPADIVLRLKGRATLREVKSALELLVKLKMVTRLKNGTYRAEETSLTSTDEITSLILQRYHKSCLELGKRAIEEEPVEKREFSSLIMPLTEGQFKSLKAKLKEFRAEAKKFESPSPDPKKIYLLNLQFFEGAE